MALASVRQDDFSGGMIYSRRSAGGVYDAVNMLVGDDGSLFRRGGDSYYSLAVASAVTGIGSVYMPVVQSARTLFWNTLSTYAIHDGSTTPADIGNLSDGARRPVVVGNYYAFPGSSGPLGYTLYAGSVKANAYATGTISVSSGSTTVTGSGTSWSTSVDAGMFFLPDGDSNIGVVKSVGSNTSITLADPWAGGTIAGGTYVIAPITAETFSFLVTGSSGTRAAAAGSGSPRFVLAGSNRAYLSDRGDPTSFDSSVYLELPAGALITGAEGYGDSCFLFTPSGVWRADNLSLDPIDDAGNQQWTQQRISGAIRLWGENGIASWQGHLIVPAVDDVLLMAPDGSSVSLTGDPQNQKIRSLYRSYVNTSGYGPGYAAVWQGTYILPIVSGGTWVDTLVCRLDRGAVWTRWSGHAAGTGFAPLAPETMTATRRLLAVNGASDKKVVDAKGAFSPAAANSRDADGTDIAATIITNDYVTQDGIQQGTVMRARIVYEATGDGTHTNPAVALAYSSDQDGDSYTTLTTKGEQGGGTGWGTSDGSKYQWAQVVKKRTRVRFKITLSNTAATFVLRAIELLIRPSGKQ